MRPLPVVNICKWGEMTPLKPMYFWPFIGVRVPFKSRNLPKSPSLSSPPPSLQTRESFQPKTGSPGMLVSLGMWFVGIYMHTYIYIYSYISSRELISPYPTTREKNNHGLKRAGWEGISQFAGGSLFEGFFPKDIILVGIYVINNFWDYNF